MRGTDFVGSVGADQHQVLHIRLRQQILDHIERCRVEPLQIVDEQRNRMVGACKYAYESTEDQLESGFCVFGWKIRDRWLLSYDERQFRDEVHDKSAVRIQRLTKVVAPLAQLFVALSQKRTDQTLKGLC